ACFSKLISVKTEFSAKHGAGSQDSDYNLILEQYYSVMSKGLFSDTSR
ncbi:unnamed protein product, partial [Larinioides sclopetarius]